MTDAKQYGGAPSVETAYGWVIVAASIAYITVTFGSAHLIIVGLKPVAAEFDWPRWVPSAVYSALMIGAGTGGVIMGIWSDRVGVGKPAVVGGCLFGVGVILASRAESAWGMIAVFGIVVGAVGAGTAFSPLIANATKWFDRRRGIAVAAIASGQGVSGLLWPNLLAWGIDGWGWRDTWFAYGVGSFFILLPAAFFLQRRPPTSPSAVAGMPTSPTELALEGWPIWLILAMISIAIVGCCVAMAMPVVHLVAYVTDLGLPLEEGAVMLSLLLACGGVSRMGFGWLSDRIGGLRTILIGSALQAAALACYALVESVFGLYLLSALFGIAFGGIVPGYALAIRELLPDKSLGLNMGIVFLFGTVGMALGGFLGGWIFDLTGAYRPAFLTGVAFNMVNLVAIAVLIWSQSGGMSRLMPDRVLNT